VPEPEEPEPPANGGKSPPSGVARLTAWLTSTQALITAVVAVFAAMTVGLAKCTGSADSTRFAMCTSSFELFCPDKCVYEDATITGGEKCFQPCAQYRAESSSKTEDVLKTCLHPVVEKDPSPPPNPTPPPNPNPNVAQAGMEPAIGGGRPPNKPPDHPPPPPSDPGRSCPIERVFAEVQTVMSACRLAADRTGPWHVVLKYDEAGVAIASVSGTQASDARCKTAFGLPPHTAKTARASCTYTVDSTGAVQGHP
jgi:hypothetical protein